MKKCVFILMVCLMATAAFAANVTWTSTTGGSWSNAANWSAAPASPGVYNDEYRIYFNSMTNPAVIDSAVGPYNGRIRISGGMDPTNMTPAKLNIVAGGSITIAEFRVGDQGISGTSGSVGLVTQTGGSVLMSVSSSGTSYSRNIIIGRGGSSGPVAKGQYVISGGSINYTADAANTALLLVGASPNVTGSQGTFTVVGSAASITMKKLYVGSDATATRGGNGTMEFQVVNGLVSKVKLTDADSIILDNMGAGSVANLLVSATGTVPTADILLIENASTGAVQGAFDGAAEGAIFNVGGVNMSLTYQYIGSGDGIANDIALVIPEPATIALLSIGLLAIRRNRK